MDMLATLPDVVLAAPWAFTVGVVVGFVLTFRYTLVRRNGHKRDRDVEQRTERNDG